jgi:hypothetical protein
MKVYAYLKKGNYLPLFLSILFQTGFYRKQESTVTFCNKQVVIKKGHNVK